MMPRRVIPWYCPCNPISWLLWVLRLFHCLIYRGTLWYEMKRRSKVLVKKKNKPQHIEGESWTKTYVRGPLLCILVCLENFGTFFKTSWIINSRCTFEPSLWNKRHQRHTVDILHVGANLLFIIISFHLFLSFLFSHLKSKSLCLS